MSSRWPVETIAAERLNTSMFSSVLFRKEQYSEALQAAQLAMIRDESDQARQHPRFWASFVVNGHAFARQHNDGSIFIEITLNRRLMKKRTA